MLQILGSSVRVTMFKFLIINIIQLAIYMFVYDVHHISILAPFGHR